MQLMCLKKPVDTQRNMYIYFFLNNGHLSDRCSLRDVIYRLKPGISQVVPSPIIVRVSGMGGGGTTNFGRRDRSERIRAGKSLQ